MDRLLFPVKLGPEVRNVSREFEPTRLGVTRERISGRRVWAVRLAAGALMLLSGCGYQSVYGHPSQRYGVAPGVYSTSSFEAVAAVAAGVRSELGAAQALGDGFPRVVVEVLRVDERSIGVLSASGTSGPLARGSEIIVVGRARIEPSEGVAPTFDTGDLSRAAQFASGTSPTADSAARSRAVRDAARQLGKALARSILGIPEPAEG